MSGRLPPGYEFVPGRGAHAETAAIRALRADSALVSLLGNANRVKPGSTDDEPNPVMLIVEVIATGSQQDKDIEKMRITLQVTPVATRTWVDGADPMAFKAIRDRAYEVLKDGMPAGYAYRGGTDDISFPRPRSGTEVEAVMQYAGRLQFIAQQTDDADAA